MNKITTFSEYSRAAASTQMESCKNEDYLRFGLISEVGELCAIFKRAIRGDFKLEDKREDILLELGDICWYLDRLLCFYDCIPCEINEYGLVHCDTPAGLLFSLADCATHPYLKRCSDRMHSCYRYINAIGQMFGYTLADVLTANVEKLAKRKERGLIMGSGDNR